MVTRSPDTPPPWRPADTEGAFIAERVQLFRIAYAVAAQHEWSDGMCPEDVVSLARFLSGDTQ